MYYQCREHINAVLCMSSSSDSPHKIRHFQLHFISECMPVLSAGVYCTRVQLPPHEVIFMVVTNYNVLMHVYIIGDTRFHTQIRNATISQPDATRNTWILY